MKFSKRVGSISTITNLLKKIEKVTNQFNEEKPIFKEKYFFNKISISTISLKDFIKKEINLKENKNVKFIESKSLLFEKHYCQICADDSVVGLLSYVIIQNIIIIEKIAFDNITVGKKSLEEDICLSEVLFLNDMEVLNIDNFKFYFDSLKLEIQAIFFEFEMDLPNTQENEIFLHEIDAKWIPFENYSLLTQQKGNHRLLCFPQLVGDVFSIKSNLVEFLLTLKYPNIKSDKLKEQIALIEYEKGVDFIYLQQIPQKEDSQVDFKRVSICLEILVDDDYLEKDYLEKYNSDEDDNKSSNGKNELDKFKILKTHNFSYYIKKKPDGEDKLSVIKEFLPTNGYCIFTHSYETDLFSYKYQLTAQSTPPYYTKNYVSGKDFEIEFSKINEFISEGRKEQFYTDIPKLVKMKGYANYTYFFNSRIRVWHLVLTPDNIDSLNELDIIKIMKLFSGFQEKGKKDEDNKLDRNYLNFKWKQDGKPKESGFNNIDSFFQYLTGIKYEFQKNKGIKDINELLTSGIVSIDMNQNNYRNADNTDEVKKEISSKFEALYNIIHGSSDDLNTTNPYVESVFKALCGITLGIFDFGRMGIEEVYDTLAPREKSITPTSFLTINRGVLTSFALGDDVFNSAWKTLGMNPYLMIPSAVLAHNDYVSRDAENKLNTAWSLCSPDSKIEVSIKELIDERNDIDDLINDDILSNVFQYPTEQELYIYGMKHRGIDERISEVKSKLVQLDKIIEQKQTQKTNENDKIIQFVLAVLSLLQIASFLADFKALGIDNKTQEWKYTNLYTFIVMTILLLGGTVWYYIFFKDAPVKINKKSKNDKFVNNKKINPN